MINILIPFLTVFLTLSAYASSSSDSSAPYYDFLTKKTVQDFRAGVKLYNEKKEANAPVIKKGVKQFYNIVYKTARVRFTLVNYLNDQMYVNDRLVKRSTFGLKKTTWLNPLVSEAIASDEELDGETTQVLLTALGNLSGKLEEVGMICFSACEKDVRTKNKTKILSALDRQYEDCNEQLYAQEDTIKRYPTYQMVSMLHSTFDSEFASVKNFIQKISEANSKKVKEFMAKNMAITKNHQTCIQVIATGTPAETSTDMLKAGANILSNGGVTSEMIAQELEKAKGICVKMEELKTCLVTLKKNLGAINSIKRATNKPGNSIPLETLPEMKALER